jgi:putative selenium metabolism protein SsnA
MSDTHISSHSADQLLITNGIIVTWKPEADLLESGAVYIKEGRVQEIGPSSALESRYPNVEYLDARGQLVMPGNICAHTHFYGAFARGMAIPDPVPTNFPEILSGLWWPLDQALDRESVHYSALVCLIDAIKHGTTTLFDHHASPNALEGSLDTVADAVEASGLRAVLCYEVTDRYGPQSTLAGIEENVRFLKSASGRSSMAAVLGLHALLTISEETLEACAQAAKSLHTGLHLHVAEDRVDEDDSLAKTGLRIVERLYRAEALGEKTIAAHAVHIDSREMSLLRDTGTWVTHQPRSNMNNGVGVADMDGMLHLGVKLCLGNDGFSNNMWAEWKAAEGLQKIWHRDPRRATGMNIVQMAVHNNAALAAQFFPDTPPGYLQPGAAADIIMVDYHPTTPMTAGNLPWHILYGFESSMVTTTICAGRVLMRDRVLLTLDEEAITSRSRELAQQVWKRYEAIRKQ